MQGFRSAASLLRQQQLIVPSSLSPQIHEARPREEQFAQIQMKLARDKTCPCLYYYLRKTIFYMGMHALKNNYYLTGKDESIKGEVKGKGRWGGILLLAE